MARTRVDPPGRKADGSRSRLDLLRWQAGCGTFGVPQAAAPIAFALVALPITGAAESGAAMVFAMTAAQVLGAVPVSRLGRRFNAVRYLRALIAVRTAAFAAVTVLAAREAPFALLIAAVIAAGAVNGAAYGYQRLLLNHLVEPAGLPRALGVAATLNEIAFALSPVAASLLGGVSPVWAMAAITALGVRLGRTTAKGVTGYDLCGLIVGSEATLGLITEIPLRLVPARTGTEHTIVGYFDTLTDAGRAVAAISADGIIPSALELIDRFCLQAVDDWKNMGLAAEGDVLLLARTDTPRSEEHTSELQ